MGECVVYRAFISTDRKDAFMNAMRYLRKMRVIDEYFVGEIKE